MKSTVPFALIPGIRQSTTTKLINVIYTLGGPSQFETCRCLRALSLSHSTPVGSLQMIFDGLFIWSYSFQYGEPSGTQSSMIRCLRSKNRVIDTPY